jgi:hypothetical protein
VATEPDDPERVSAREPEAEKVIEILKKVRDTLRANRHLAVNDAVARVNPDRPRMGELLPSRQLEPRARYGANRRRGKVRRFAVKKRKRKGFGWMQWSSAVVYGSWGLFDDYGIRYSGRAKASPTETAP